VADVFYVWGLPALAAALLIVFVVSIEVGFRFGRLARSRATSETHSLTGVLQSALLGLLALLLGFTFSMAASRHDSRQQLVIEEANAIGTAFLRAQLLPEPRRGEASALLLSYLDSRVAFLTSSAPPSSDSRMPDLQHKLWATTGNLDEAGTATVLLYVAALNTVFDEEGKRSAAFYNRVPEAALLVLIMLAAASLAVLGYGAGLAGRRSTMCMLTSVLVVIVVLLIVDLDRPRSGLIIIDETSLVELRKELRGWGKVAEVRVRSGE
jgi:hypothetical protein